MDNCITESGIFWIEVYNCKFSEPNDKIAA